MLTAAGLPGSTYNYATREITIADIPQLAGGNEFYAAVDGLDALMAASYGGGAQISFFWANVDYVTAGENFDGGEANAYRQDVETGLERRQLD